jgi:hypothetical protein
MYTFRLHNREKWCHGIGSIHVLWCVKGEEVVTDVNIYPQYLTCRKRWLNRSCPSDETAKTDTLCLSRLGTINIPPCSTASSVERGSNLQQFTVNGDVSIWEKTLTWGTWKQRLICKFVHVLQWWIQKFRKGGGRSWKGGTPRNSKKLTNFGS